MFYLGKEHSAFSLIRINDDIAKPQQKIFEVNLFLQPIHLKLIFQN